MADTTYTAISTFQYPDGVVLEGQTVSLADDVAARGLETGALVVTPTAPEPPASPPASPPPVPPAAPVVSEAPAAPAQQSESKE